MYTMYGQWNGGNNEWMDMGMGIWQFMIVDDRMLFGAVSFNIYI